MKYTHNFKFIYLTMVERNKTRDSSEDLYIFQAVFVYFLFGEELSVRWWLGTVLIVAGIALLGGRVDGDDQDKVKNSKAD